MHVCVKKCMCVCACVLPFHQSAHDFHTESHVVCTHVYVCVCERECVCMFVCARMCVPFHQSVDEFHAERRVGFQKRQSTQICAWLYWLCDCHLV